MDPHGKDVGLEESGCGVLNILRAYKLLLTVADEFEFGLQKCVELWGGKWLVVVIHGSSAGTQEVGMERREEGLEQGNSEPLVEIHALSL